MNFSRCCCHLFYLCALGGVASAEKVFLVIGQSNAAGRGELPDTPTELEGVYVFDSNNEFIPATENINYFSTICPFQKEGYSLAYTFGETLHETLGEEIKIVSNAQGGTSIRLWQPGEELYEAAVAVTKDALDEAGSNLSGILWLQGESDSACCVGGYADNLQTLIEGMRSEFGSNVPFVAGELSTDREAYIDINNVLNDLVGDIDHFDVVSSNGLTTDDGVHFDTESLREYGVRYANAIRPLLSDDDDDDNDDDDDGE